MAEKLDLEGRIAHFLKLAEDPGATQAERDTASEQAERLMLKHGIDRAMLSESEHKDEAIVKIEHVLTGTYAMEQMLAANHIVEAIGLRSYFSDRRSFNKTIVVFIVGFESDAADALNLVRSLETQCAVAVRSFGKTLPSWMSAMEKYKARREFIQYFGRGAAKRIRSNRAKIIVETVASTAGTELVLASRTEKVDNYYEGLGLRTRNLSRSASGYGMGAGYSAGQNANTGERGISGSSRGVNA